MGGTRGYLKGPMEQRKGIVQMYTASIQQIGRALRDEGENIFFIYRHCTRNISFLDILIIFNE